MLRPTMEERHVGDVLLVINAKAERRVATEANMMLMVADGLASDVTTAR